MLRLYDQMLTMDVLCARHSLTAWRQACLTFTVHWCCSLYNSHEACLLPLAGSDLGSNIKSVLRVTDSSLVAGHSVEHTCHICDKSS